MSARVLVALIFGLCVSSASFAQQSTAESLTGVIRDGSGAVVPGATVIVGTMTPLL